MNNILGLVSGPSIKHRGAYGTRLRLRLFSLWLGAIRGAGAGGRREEGDCQVVQCRALGRGQRGQARARARVRHRAEDKGEQGHGRVSRAGVAARRAHPWAWAGDWPTEVREQRRPAAIRKNVRHHARDRLPYSTPLDLRLGLFPGWRSRLGAGARQARGDSSPRRWRWAGGLRLGRWQGAKDRLSREGQEPVEAHLSLVPGRIRGSGPGPGRLGPRCRV